MDFAHRADCAISDPFVDLAIAFEGHALVAHLRGDFRFARGFGDCAGFVNGAGERLFAIDMLAHANGGHRNDGVIVIGRADNDGIDAFFLVEHLAEIFVAFGFRISFESFGGVIPIHIAERDDIFVFDWLRYPNRPGRRCRCRRY